VAVPLARSPAEEYRAGLMDRALRPATDDEQIQDRDLAILALGTDVDRDMEVLDLFSRILTDTSRVMMQARPPVCYVLARAHGDRARSLLRSFLADPQLESEGKDLASLWFAESGGDRMVLENAARTLADPDSEYMDRVMALGAISKQSSAGSPDDMPYIEELYCLQATREKDDFLRRVTIDLLSELAGGDARMATLSYALREDGSPKVRTAAVRGMLLSPDDRRAEVHADLLAALSREQDAVVAEAIRKALEEIESS